jgi:hypothetical protein
MQTDYKIQHLFKEDAIGDGTNICAEIVCYSKFNSVHIYYHRQEIDIESRNTVAAIVNFKLKTKK